MPTYGWILIAVAFALGGLFIGAFITRRRLREVFVSNAMREESYRLLQLRMGQSEGLTSAMAAWWHARSLQAEDAEASSVDDLTPDLLEISENQSTPNAVQQLGEGFDRLFLRLGPPPEGAAAGLQPTHQGGGTSDDT